MAGNFYCREFANLAKDGHGETVMVGAEPALADQKLAFAATGVSMTLDDRTRFVEIHTDAVCHYRVNAASVSTDSMRLGEGATVFKGVVPGSGRQIWVVEGS